MPQPTEIFDQALLIERRRRAANSGHDGRFLLTRVLEDVSERLSFIQRQFPTCLLLNAYDRQAVEDIQSLPNIGTVIAADNDAALLANCPEPKVVLSPAALPFSDGALDCIISPLTLHWINDLPGRLIQFRQALRKDGLLLAILPGGRTLHELRASWLAAEEELTGGVSPRVAPFVDIRDFGGLLQRAGFALPVVDSELVTVTYPNPIALYRDLKGMGASNCLTDRRLMPVTRRLLTRASEIYIDRFSTADGSKIVATIELLTATAWTPDESQQKPLRPGSAKTRLAEALGVEEKKI
jgi:NADH dehydrogenase [ubiquinone] 1 alpha subcomplex assembly factor 5